MARFLLARGAMLFVSMRPPRVLSAGGGGLLLWGCCLLALCGCGTTSGEPRRMGGGGASGAGGVTINLGGDTSGGGATGAGGKTGTMQVECFSSGDCPSQRPHCVVTQGRCVECVSNANCMGAIGGRYCGPMQTCVQCIAEDQCTAAQPYCSDAGQCVQCLTARNCGNSKAACNPVTNHCVGACDTSDDCAATTGFPFCKEDQHECVQCLQDDQCPDATPRCLVDAGECAVCAGDDDCSGSTPRCDTASNHTCVECLVNEDCSGGYICQTRKCVVVPG